MQASSVVVEAETLKRATPKPTRDRGELIAEALKVRTRQARMLDDLDPEARRKLKAMAQAVLGEAVKRG